MQYFNQKRSELVLTRGDGVHQRADDLAVVPVVGEVADWSVWDFVLYPGQQPLFGRLLWFLGDIFVVAPHGHGDGVVEDESPY